MHIFSLGQPSVCVAPLLTFVVLWTSFKHSQDRQRTNNRACTERTVVGSVLPHVALAMLLMLTNSSEGTAQMPGQGMPVLPQVRAAQVEQGAHATVGDETGEITVCGGSAISFVAKPNPSVAEVRRPWMLDARDSCSGAPFTYVQDSRFATIKKETLEVV